MRNVTNSNRIKHHDSINYFKFILSPSAVAISVKYLTIDTFKKNIYINPSSMNRAIRPHLHERPTSWSREEACGRCFWAAGATVCWQRILKKKNKMRIYAELFSFLRIISRNTKMGIDFSIIHCRNRNETCWEVCFWWNLEKMKRFCVFCWKRQERDKIIPPPLSVHLWSNTFTCWSV